MSLKFFLESSLLKVIKITGRYTVHVIAVKSPPLPCWRLNIYTVCRYIVLKIIYISMCVSLVSVIFQKTLQKSRNCLLKIVRSEQDQFNHLRKFGRIQSSNFMLNSHCTREGLWVQVNFQIFIRNCTYANCDYQVVIVLMFHFCVFLIALILLVFNFY